MGITIGFDFFNKKTLKEEPKSTNDIETNLLNNIISMLSDVYDSYLFTIEKMSNDYTTLRFYNYDVCRLKYTDRSKWIKLLIDSNLKDKYINSELFNSQKNKNELYWKSTLASEDFTIYKEIMLNTCELALKNK